MVLRVPTRGRNRLRVGPALIPRSAFALRDARREENQGTALLSELRCECARRECEATVPAEAAAHRRRAGWFIVAPDHVAGETVVAAADRFFVVEQLARPSSS